MVLLLSSFKLSSLFKDFRKHEVTSGFSPSSFDVNVEIVPEEFKL